MQTEITTAHQQQIAALGSALHSPGARRQRLNRERAEFDLVQKMLSLASQGYTRRYASQILGLTADQAYRLCKRHFIDFADPRKD